jgi:hypothetical protein
MPEAVAKREQYWATKQVAELLPDAVQKVKDHERYIVSSGLFKVMYKSCEMAQGGLRFHELLKGGKKGQYDLVRVNHYGNILTHTHLGITGERPSFSARAINGDFASRAQSEVCDGALEYYCSELKAEQRQNEAMLNMLDCGEAIRFQRWDPHAGRMIDVQQNRPVYEGSIRDDVVHPVDLIRDWSLKKYVDSRWLIVRTRENRYDLAALYGDDNEKREAILHATPERYGAVEGREIRLLKANSLTTQHDSDEIDVYYLLHDRTPSLPFGRWVKFIDGVTWLEDGDLEERGIKSIHDCVIRVAAAEIKNVPAGYTFMWDLLALQQAVNIAESIALTSVNKFGMQHLSAPAGAIVSTRDVGEGLTLFELEGVTEGEIKGINLMALPDVVLELGDRWVTAMERISGVNSVTRGEPPAGVKAGAPMALLQAQFLSFSAGGQRAYVQMWEDSGTGYVRCFRHNVKQPRLAAIVGSGKAAYVKELVGSDLDGVDRVRCEISPYMARTPAGRMEMADKLLTAGAIDGEEYMHVNQHGELNSILHKRTAEPNYIQRENEFLLDPSKPVPEVIDDDNHELHLAGHHELLFDPDVRDDPQKVILDRVLAHQTQHKTALARLAAATAQLGGDPAAALGGGAPPMPPGGAPPAEPPMAGSGDSEPEVPSVQVPLGVTNMATGREATVRMPQPADTLKGAA